MASVVVVEEVTGAPARRRFVDLPHVLDGADPRFAPLVLAWERYRLDRHRNPYLAEADWVLLLARRGGRPVGRISAHLVDGDAEGRFGHWWVPDDRDVADALLDAAQAWLAERGCTTMTGPVTFTPDQEVGVLVEGVEVPGVTGRPWHPPHLADLLVRSGFEVATRHRRWRLTVPAGDPVPAPGGRTRPPDGPAGPYADPRLVLPAISAVPDVSGALRAPRLRGALAAARRARAGDWVTAVVVGCPSAPASDVPALLRAAAMAGYRELVAPWTPDDVPPETVHATFTRSL
jgi:hypothetical protein